MLNTISTRNVYSGSINVACFRWLEAMKSMCASFFYDFIPPTTSGCDPQSVITDFEVESTPSQSTSSDEGEDVENGQEGGDEGVTTNSHDVSTSYSLP